MVQAKQAHRPISLSTQVTQLILCLVGTMHFKEFINIDKYKVLFSVLTINKPPNFNFFFLVQGFIQTSGCLFAASPDFLGWYLVLEIIRFPKDFWFFSNWKYSKKSFSSQPSRISSSCAGWIQHTKKGIKRKP